MAELWVAIAVGGAIGLALGQLWKWSSRWARSNIPYAAPVFDVMAWPLRKYFDLFRWVLPDAFYKFEYRCGVMDAESYRYFQDRGWIRDDTDPEYIQRRAN